MVFTTPYYSVYTSALCLEAMTLHLLFHDHRLKEQILHLEDAMRKIWR